MDAFARYLIFHTSFEIKCVKQKTKKTLFCPSIEGMCLFLASQKTGSYESMRLAQIFYEILMKGIRFIEKSTKNFGKNPRNL